MQKVYKKGRQSLAFQDKSEHQYSSNREKIQWTKRVSSSFILLELLIALFLIGICAAPLIKNPIKMFKDEVFTIQKMEIQRIAELDFAELKERLYRHEISWKEIEKSSKASSFLPTEKKEVKLGEGFAFSYEKKCYLWLPEEKNISLNEKEKISLINLKISYQILPTHSKKKRLCFSHKIFVKRTNKFLEQAN